VLDKK